MEFKEDPTLEAIEDDIRRLEGQLSKYTEAKIVYTNISPVIVLVTITYMGYTTQVKFSRLSFYNMWNNPELRTKLAFDMLKQHMQTYLSDSERYPQIMIVDGN